jgi:cell division protein FtsB
MPLATAIRSNAAVLADSHKTYKEHVIDVNTLVTSVLSSSLPTLYSVPPDWDDFVTAYVQANSDALDWVNDVLARLLDVPDEVRNYDDIITQLLDDAKSQAGTLVDDPGNQAALLSLNQDLSSLSSQLNLVVSFISGAVSSVQRFKDKMPDMAQQLESIASNSTKAAGADQQQIDQLNADIDHLRAEIKSLTASIVGLAIMDGVALTIGTAATIALWPVGAVTWFLMGPAVAVASVYIALDAMQLKADKAKIEADQRQIDALTADVATLHVLAQNYATMADEASTIEDSLQAILAAWQSLESEVNQAIDDIKAGISDAASADYQAVLDEVNDAIAAWADAYAQAGDLHLDLNVNDAELQFGMSSEEVKAAMDNAQTVDIIQYYNKVAA